jgi:transposase
MPTGKWFACFSVDMGSVQLPLWKGGLVVGIDVGLESFATLSNGEKISNPRFFLEEEKEFARVQRKLSKTPKGTPECRVLKVFRTRFTPVPVTRVMKLDPRKIHWIIRQKQNGVTTKQIALDMKISRRIHCGNKSAALSEKSSLIYNL